MKLFRFFTVAVMVLLAGIGASAQDTAKEDVRIYINPGHGSWGPNNRHCATIGHSPISSENPDTTDFFESNTNLRKGLAMLERLAEYGIPFDKTKNQDNEIPSRVGAALDLEQNIVMSHVKCGPFPYETVDGVSPDNNNQYNRNLSEIAAEVEDNDFDLFISIHSNAATDGSTVNYLYFLYRTSHGADAEMSVAFAQALWNQRILDRHTQWTHYDYLIPAGGAGKIEDKNYIVCAHSVPGFIVEGYFHTYQPARHRYMNFDVCRNEGEDYARGVADLFGWEKENTGTIYGIVRDKYEKFSHELYTARVGTDDVYKPLNDVVVILKKNGEQVATDTTDVNYNGAFVFRNVEPGDYTLEFSHPDYKPQAPTAVTVKSAITEYPTVFLEGVNYVAPTITYVNYPDSLAGKTGYAVYPTYNVKGKASSPLAASLEGKTVRRQLIRDGKLYVLALDAENAPYIYYVDIASGIVTELDKAAIAARENDFVALSDIALTADGYLVGSSFSTNTFGGTATVQFYKWTKNELTGDPETCEAWITTTNSANCNTAFMGKSLAFSGTTKDGIIVITGEHNTRDALRFTVISVVDNASAGEAYWVKMIDPAQLPKSTFGDDYQLMVSPLYDELTAEHENIVIDGSAGAAKEWTDGGNATDVVVNGTISTDLLSAKSNGANYFKYAGRTLMAAPYINEEGKVAGIKLFDITDGFNAASEITLTGATIDPTEYTYASAHGEAELELSSDDRTIGAEMALYLVVDGKVTKYTQSVTSVTPAAGGTANPFAYALKSEVGTDALNVSYSLNAAATDVKIRLKNSDGVEIATVEAGALAAGAYTAQLPLPTEDGSYTWEVEVAGAEKSAIESFVDLSYYHPRGVDVDNNMESENFGTVYVTEGMTTSSSAYFPTDNGGVGLFIFNPDMTSVKNEVTGKYAFMGGLTYTFISYGADLARVRVADDGRIFVTRCNNTGDYILYAESQADLVKNDKFTSLMKGGTMADNYDYYIGDTFIAGPNIGLDLKGSGADLKLLTTSGNSTQFAFTSTSGSRTDEYDLGEATELPAPTAIEGLSGYTIAPQVTNVEYDDRGGIWYCQYRTNPSESQPALIYVDANGEQKYFEGTGGEARGGGGIRISPDGSQIAISNSKTQFTIYNLYYDENNVPSLQPATVVTHGIGTNCYDLAWDLAGNIYIVGNSGEHFKGFAIPRSEAFTTKAATKYTITVKDGNVSGVEQIVVDDNAPVEYYNLQGIKVENPEKGIFIKKQGSKATKVVM